MLHFLQGLVVGEMDDDHGAVCRLGDAQQPADRFRLQIGGAGDGMRAGAQLAAVFPLGDHAVDDAGVLTVDAADAAQAPQLLQRPVHVPVADHHGGIGHIHFKRGDALGEHIRQLRPDALVPVVDGHVEAVVAEGPAIGLLVPQLQAVVEGLALVGTGEVDDGGGAAPQRRAAAGIKIVGGGGAGHIQVKVGVGVNEAGEQQTAGHVLHRVGGVGETAADPEDLLPVHQHVSPLHTAAGDHGAAFEQCFHKTITPLYQYQDLV